jgi:two-component system, NarL family, sensor histidine kinase UhpB
VQPKLTVPASPIPNLPASEYGPGGAALWPRERAAIAHEIHDELGAILMAIKIDVLHLAKAETTLPKAAGNRWPNLLERVDEAMAVVTTLTTKLRPGLVQELGIWKALESYTLDFQGAMAIPCELKLNFTIPPALPNDSAVEIFRLIQEALSNVARHAQASLIEIAVSCKDSHLDIEIVDNGRGILPEQIINPSSLGVAGMFRRAKHLGSHLRISRVRSGGTKVHLRTPLTRPP